MDCVERQTAEAANYLRKNKALREALGIGAETVLEPHPLGAGEHNLNFWFEVEGQKFVLRFNVLPQPFHDNQVRYEFAALRALEPSGRTPRALYVDDDAGAPENGALVISFCEGSELDFDHLREGDLERVARCIADIHAVPIDGAGAGKSVGTDGFTGGFAGGNAGTNGFADASSFASAHTPAGRCPLFAPADPLRTLFDECIQRFELYRASAFEDARVTRWVERFFAAAAPALDTDCDARDRTHIVNTEPLASHFLLADDGRTSFVDWERPIIGEVAQDVAYFTAPTTSFWDSEFLFPRDAADAFVERYWCAVDGRFPRGSFDARLRAWRMATALRSVTWCCKALTQYGHGSTSHQTEKTARKLPVYLSDEFMDMLAKECFE